MGRMLKHRNVTSNGKNPIQTDYHDWKKHKFVAYRNKIEKQFTDIIQLITISD